MLIFSSPRLGQHSEGMADERWDLLRVMCSCGGGAHSLCGDRDSSQVCIDYPFHFIYVVSHKFNIQFHTDARESRLVPKTLAPNAQKGLFQICGLILVHRLKLAQNKRDLAPAHGHCGISVDVCDKSLLLSPPNKVSEGTMKRAPYVCVCVRAQNVETCYFSVISWPILILFVLSGRAWCGLQNFYTEFWNSLIMQSYANLFTINEKCYFSVISWPILILFVLSDGAWCGLQNFYTEFWNSLIMQIYANLVKINEKCYFCHFLADFDSVCFIW